MTVEDKLIFYVNGIKITEKFGDTEVGYYHTEYYTVFTTPKTTSLTRMRDPR